MAARGRQDRIIPRTKNRENTTLRRAGPLCWVPYPWDFTYRELRMSRDWVFDSLNTPVTASASATAAITGAGYLRSLHIVDRANAGHIAIADGASAGATPNWKLDTAGSSVNEDVDLPGRGWRFRNGIHVTLNNVASVTFFTSKDKP